MAINGVSGSVQANTLGYAIEQKKNNELFQPVRMKEGQQAENGIKDRVTINTNSKEAASAGSQEGTRTRPEQGAREARNIETQQAIQAYRNVENMDNNNKPEKMRARQISMLVG